MKNGICHSKKKKPKYTHENQCEPFWLGVWCCCSLSVCDNCWNIKLHATYLYQLFVHVLTLNVTYWHDFTINTIPWNGTKNERTNNKKRKKISKLCCIQIAVSLILFAFQLFHRSQDAGIFKSNIHNTQSISSQAE